ncbi:hypothetical protein HMPREF9696_01739 [Afipia clevelandensis ATCC 49720]|uniref:Uncharacterized protein n=2 Tax=Afipia clevelandensis TaxID=1034 RepID=K8PAL6_9BRAD|nr:hypothetical protein HMPREF9696_01739 [Afipia clevelandensis ATCC 49720]
MKKDKNVMNVIANVNWKDEIGVIAGPFQPTDTKQSWLSRAARKANVSVRYITSLYYGHVKDPKFSVASSVLSAAELARIEATRREAAQLASRFEITAEGLNAKDADFFGAEINSLLDAANRLRSMGGT